MVYRLHPVMDGIHELSDLLLVRMLVIRKRGVTTHLSWLNCILIYVNKLVNVQVTAGTRFSPISHSSTNSPTTTRLRLLLVRRALFMNELINVII